MIINAYTLYDRKALTYHRPFFEISNGSAVRMVQDLCADSNNMVGRHPGDFVLYRCGAYDEQSGELLRCSPLEHVVDALAVAPGQQPLSVEPTPPPPAARTNLGAANGHVENLNNPSIK